MSLTPQHIQEDLSRAFVQAIAAKAGINLSLGNRSQDYTVDGTFQQISYSNGRRHESGFNLDFQLKATTNIDLGEPSVVKFDLDAETHNYLVERSKKPRTTPVILIVLNLPKDQTEWMALSEDQLILRRCCYWIWLDGEITPNISSTRISIPKTNLLTPETINDMLTKIENGEALI